MPRDFLKTSDWPAAELQALIESAVRFKTGTDRNQALAGRSVALVFFNPSLRTRASMQVGIYELGGNPVIRDRIALVDDDRYRRGWLYAVHGRREPEAIRAARSQRHEGSLCQPLRR